MPIGDDQAAIRWQDFLGEIGGNTEEEAVAKFPVFLPFAVRDEIGPAAFDFDDDDLALFVDRHQIGPAAIGQGKFAEGGQSQIAEQHGNAAVQSQCRIIHPASSATGRWDRPVRRRLAGPIYPSDWPRSSDLSCPDSMLSRAMDQDPSSEPGKPAATGLSANQPSQDGPAASAQPDPQLTPQLVDDAADPLLLNHDSHPVELVAPPVVRAGDKRPIRKRPPLQRIGRFILRLALIFFAGSLALVGIYRFVPPPITPLMVIRLISGEGLHKTWKSYTDISPNLARAVIASEDARFCLHNGFDWRALDKAWARNQHNRRILGGSTISNQTAKNVFLWPDRTYIRKAIEFYFTVLIEAFWGKKRILEIYLNVIEWGPGTYGAEAAARFHFKKSAHDLTRREAALLAAILPNPRHWSASKPSAYIRGRASTIEARMAAVADPTGQPCHP